MTINEMVDGLSAIYGGDSVASEWDATNSKPTEVPVSGDPMARMIVLMVKGMWDIGTTDEKNIEHLAGMFQMGETALQEIVEELNKYKKE